MNKPFNPDLKRVLVIDGYAFRGLGPLYIIDKIVKSASLRAKKPLRPCNIFDLICGTSSGGLIAILLGRLGLDCDTAITEYMNIVKACCGEDEAKLWDSVLDNKPVNGPSAYDDVLSAVIAKYSASADAPMVIPQINTSLHTNAAVFVTSGAPNFSNRYQCVSSYKGQKTLPLSHQWLIREAAHAVLATPFFGYVPPLPLANSVYDFREAAFSGFNNPVKLAQNEKLALWPNGRSILTISLGTDICSLVPDNAGKDYRITDAYCAQYVRAIIDNKLKHMTESQSSRTVDVMDIVQQVIQTAAETNGENSKFLQDLYNYRIDPPLGLDKIAFADYFQRQTVKESIDQWAADAKGEKVITAISELVVEEKKVADAEDLRRMDPQSPPPDTVNPGYNPQLDKRRPETIMEYLSKYRVLFIIDDSGSMKALWDEARDALSAIAEHALEYNAHSVDMVFLNSDKYCASVRGKSVLMQIFDEVRPHGYTPTGEILKKHLDEQIAILNAKIGSPEYTKIRPLDIVVVTDGRPDDKPEDSIADAEQEIKAKRHHPNSIGIQFVQIGNDEQAKEALQALSYGSAKVGMVDTVKYDGSLSPEKLERILLGGIHPSLRRLL
ncbi:hypothetical protein HYPSUDRAFT_85703 [Hypholoma sublateritium FD-334 SS-4]|uniref:VWFA domain-containing protein n=1 Tax=Hypholoma sublateritium (strain FD-334 SS-4) TaxID=945553 RepID=A0A0D2P899_HYPSF|nr:hypothetical protein HYPSUDRAFT_85703 [Hypholoma sublateritium FD-334 SS-4]